MSNSKISALTGATTPLAGTEVLPIVQSSTTKQVSVANLTAGRAISATSVTASTGNFVVGTSGQGIDFSATPGTGTSELLADYEEGTWTPNQGNGLTVVGTFSSSGKYTKVGRIVTVQGVLSAVTSVAIPVGASEMCTNLPFASSPAYSGSMYNAALTSSVGVACSVNSVYSSGAMGATTFITFSITYTV
jgi:hypothetical protein